jgi:SOS-response transcriptional repressor LexA
VIATDQAPMTAQQQRVLTAIEALISERQIPPTLAEIGARVGLSRPTVHAHVDGLHRRGVLTKIPGSPRSIVVAKDGRSC